MLLSIQWFKNAELNSRSAAEGKLYMLEADNMLCFTHAVFLIKVVVVPTLLILSSQLADPDL